MRQVREEDICEFGVRGSHLKPEGEVNVATVERVKRWIVSRCDVSERINPKLSSYGWKHIAEEEIGDYVSNGEFIVAALRAGARAEAGPKNPNCENIFN